MKIVAPIKVAGASLVLLAGMLVSQAATITVNNNPGAVADHATMAAAMLAAADGDTILVAGSATHYGNVSVNKTLKIIGPGYFLGPTENNVPGVTGGVDDQPATMFLFLGTDPGAGTSAQGSRFVGLTLGSVSFSVKTDLLFDRCRFTHSTTAGFNALNATNVRAARCYMDGHAYIHGTSTNCSLIGCQMERLTLANGGVATNCVVRGGGGAPITLDVGSSISNSIINRVNAGHSFSLDGSVTHCVAINLDIPGTGSGNTDGIVPGDLSTIIANTGSTDGTWQLNTGNPTNPALLGGSDGTDIGAFGGPVPYRLAGQPSIPKISNLIVPALASPTSGLNVKVTVTEPTP